MIGILLYVIASRPDVMQVVRKIARFQETPKETPLLVVKRIFKYLQGTKEFGLWYPKGNKLTLVSYIDVDWERIIDYRRSKSGATFFLGDCLVYWLSNKQTSIYLSIEKS